MEWKIGEGNKLSKKGTMLGNGVGALKKGGPLTMCVLLKLT